jgi:hypothetical protein
MVLISCMSYDLFSLATFTSYVFSNQKSFTLPIMTDLFTGKIVFCFKLPFASKKKGGWIRQRYRRLSISKLFIESNFESTEAVWYRLDFRFQKRDFSNNNHRLPLARAFLSAPLKVHKKRQATSTTVSQKG